MTPTMHFRYIYGHLHQFWKAADFEGEWRPIEEFNQQHSGEFNAPDAWLKEEMEAIGL